MSTVGARAPWMQEQRYQLALSLRLPHVGERQHLVAVADDGAVVDERRSWRQQLGVVDPDLGFLGLTALRGFSFLGGERGGSRSRRRAR